MNTILGIDPGAKGFLTVMFHDGGTDHFAIEDHDMLDLARYIGDMKARFGDLHAVMEEVHAVFGSSAKSTFAFGEINGYIKGILTALEVPYTLVQPKTWQKEIWINQDMVYDVKRDKEGKQRRVVNTKQTSFNAVRRIFPNTDMRKNYRCRKWDDNKVDSLLITEYARRKNL